MSAVVATSSQLPAPVVSRELKSSARARLMLWALAGLFCVVIVIALTWIIVSLLGAEPQALKELRWRLPGARIDQNPILWLTLGMTKALAVVTGLLAVAIIIARWNADRAEARAEQFSKIWRPLILQRIMGEKPRFPAIAPADWPHLFVLWNHLHESLQGDSREQLNNMAKEVGMRDLSRRYLEGTDLRRQVLALLAAGNMRDQSVWAKAAEMVEDENPVRSAAALRCLLRLNPKVALPKLMPLVAKRTDWSPVRVAIFLKDVGAEMSAQHLADAALTMPPHEAARLLKYMGAVGSNAALPAVRKLLETTEEPNVIAACLPLLRQSDDLPTLRRFIDHPSWFVRVQAIVALGRHGKMGDEGLLIPLLSDSQWWVRYRAAQALAGMTHLGEGWMRALHADLSDRYARDIVGQALAEFYAA